MRATHQYVGREFYFDPSLQDPLAQALWAALTLEFIAVAKGQGWEIIWPTVRVRGLGHISYFECLITMAELQIVRRGR